MISFFPIFSMINSKKGIPFPIQMATTGTAFLGKEDEEGEEAPRPRLLPLQKSCSFCTSL
jgi:hypothetical protein